MSVFRNLMILFLGGSNNRRIRSMYECAYFNCYTYENSLFVNDMFFFFDRYIESSDTKQRADDNIPFIAVVGTPMTSCVFRWSGC